MNSIVQEASSIAKAVQQAWEKAGKPSRFSIRIFEDAQKNFFGITSKPAKIALLFEIADVPKPAKTQKQATSKQEESSRKYQQQQHQRKHSSTDRRDQSKKKYGAKPKKPVNKEVAPAQKTLEQIKTSSFEQGSKAKVDKKAPLIQEAPSEKKTKALWNDDMVAMARTWMNDFLAKHNKQNAKFSTEIKRYHMKFLFDKPIFDDEIKQKNLFRNVAYLIMQSIRNKQKKQLRYHKIVITSDK